MSIKNVVLIGAGGNLGPAVLNALLPEFNVTVLSRQSSKSTFPPSVNVVTVSDDYPHQELVAAFKGQDAVVSMVAAASMGAQINIIDAAIEAKVQRFLPGEFGVDTMDPETLQLMPVLKGKKDVIDYLVSKENTGLSWTGVATSIFFDWALKLGYLKIDIPNKRAFVLDDGNGIFAATSLSTVGQTVAKVLQNPDKTKNMFLYVQDFPVSLNQIITELEKTTGGKFEVEKQSTKSFIETAQAKLNTDAYMSGMYDLIYALVMRTHQWESRSGFGNDLLGLETANFEEAIQKIVAEVDGSER